MVKYLKIQCIKRAKTLDVHCAYHHGAHYGAYYDILIIIYYALL